MNEEAKDPEFTQVDLTGQAPDGICSICAKRGVLHVPTSTAIVYCEHRLTGAYRILNNQWKRIRGIEQHAFRELVARGLTMGELRVELERELKMIIGEQGEGATKH